MAPITPLVWFITGGSAGLGAALSLHALKSGHKVIATARNTVAAKKAYPEVESLGGHWVALDVTSSQSGLVLEEAIEIYGRIDVLVNNAGYSLLGAVEDISDEEAEDQFATNFFGPLRLIRSILPSFRAQKSGVIVNVTSIAGFDGLPTCGLYAGSKFALEGLSESLRHEVAEFGIRVLVVEPGNFRTRFLQSNSRVAPKKETTSAYLGLTVGKTLEHFEDIDGKQRGDPEKGAARIFDAVAKTGAASKLEKEYMRLPIGADCFERMDKKVLSLTENIEAMRSFSANTDV